MSSSMIFRIPSLNSHFFRTLNKLNISKSSIITQVIPQATASVRWSSFRSSNSVEDISQYPKVEVVRNPPEWKFVERLLPSTVVPQPKVKLEYPSGWTPQSSDALKYPYFVGRSKNHMVPVYLSRKYRGTRRITIVRRIQGDIWKLEAELHANIENILGRKIITRVNEMSGQIQFKGDHVTIIKDLLVKKGF